MKNYYKIIFAALILSVFFLTSCEDEDTTVTGTVPTAVTNLEATSIDSNTIHIRFEPSSYKDSTGFTGYIIKWTSETGATDSEIIPSNYNGAAYPLDELTAGVVYTIEITAENANGSSPKTSIQWSPAFRLNETFNEVPINIYGVASTKGSGLKIDSIDNTVGFEADGPLVLSIAEKALWNFAFDDKTTDGMVGFMSADLTDIGAGTNARTPGKLSLKIVDESDLSNVFDSKALNDAATHAYASRSIELDDSKYSNGIVAFFSITENGNTNYGKILIEKVGGTFIQDATSSDPYIKCKISYQRTDNVPYASTIKKLTNNN